jgi:pimeloyl-ACP methyl ester carboxylesterase
VIGYSEPETTIVATPANPKHTSFASLRQINAGALNVGFAETGPADGQAVILLHGWPYDIHCYLDVAPILAAAGYGVIVPYLRGYGTTRFLSGNTFRDGEQLVMAVDAIAFMDALKIQKAVVGGFDWGGRAALIMAELWPERCKGLVSVSGYDIINLVANQQPLPPKAELGWWYQYYFTTERGRLGYSKNTYDFNKLIWKLASPHWNFDDATFDRTASAFSNPDHVAIVIHNYRWRLSLAPGDPKLDGLNATLQAEPVIAVPTITIGSDFDGAAASGESYRKQFSGKYSHVTLKGIGHNVPQEAPEIFAKAVIDVNGYS